MSMPANQTLELASDRLFISYAKEDFARADEIHKLLAVEGFLPWMDRVDLVAGQDWDSEIRKAIKAAKLFLILLSTHAVTKKGYVQKELREALDVADTLPEGHVYIVPVRLDDCTVPTRIAKWQWIDVFSALDYPHLSRSVHFHLGTASIKGRKQPTAGERRIQKADRLFAKLCQRNSKFLYGFHKDGRHAITDGRMMMFRINLNRTLEKIKIAKFLDSREADTQTITRLIPPPEVWSSNQAISFANVNAYTRKLSSQSGMSVGIGTEYWEIIKLAYPNDEFYLNGPANPIIVAEPETLLVDAIVMPRMLASEGNKTASTGSN